MTGFEALRWMDATDQASLVKRGEVSPAELVDAAIARIEAHDPGLGAVVTPLFEEARAQVDALGPGEAAFLGVPFLLKDLGATQAGLPYYAGNRALRAAGYRSSSDTPLGARFREVGLITVGKSNTCEFGAQTTTQPLAFGPTRNPWNRERSPGGSSGGSAAAVASGLVPIAHANDGGGSIRMPAAWCGLVGLKPSRGRVSLMAGSVSRIVCELGVSRTVRDTAALLDAVAGVRAGELFAAPPPARPYLEEIQHEPPALRVGVMYDTLEATTHPECRAGLRAAAETIASLGHVVIEAHPPALLEEERRPRTVALSRASFRYTLRNLGRMLGREVREADVEPYLWGLAELDQPPVTAEAYLEASEWLQAWVERVCRWWDTGFDLLLTPTVCEPPVPLVEMEPRPEAPASLPRVRSQLAFTQPFNWTGQPAISLPLHRSAEGLPVGVQAVAAYGREDLLLRLAAQLERAAPWEARRPPDAAHAEQGFGAAAEQR